MRALDRKHTWRNANFSYVFLLLKFLLECTRLIFFRGFDISFAKISCVSSECLLITIAELSGYSISGLEALSL